MQSNLKDEQSLIMEQLRKKYAGGKPRIQRYCKPKTTTASDDTIEMPSVPKVTKPMQRAALVTVKGLYGKGSEKTKIRNRRKR